MTGGPWVYQQSEAGDGVDSFPLYTVGYYDPTGRWEPESDHTTAEAAAARVHYLNGGTVRDLTCPNCRGEGCFGPDDERCEPCGGTGRQA